MAETNPALWRYVSALDPLDHINKALDLSRSMSISAFYVDEIGLDPRVSEEEFMAAVEPHAARWGHAAIFYEDLNGAPVQVWESSKLSQLHTLDLRSSSDEYTRRISLGGELELPNLREATFANIPVWLNPGQLPGLRFLQLSEYRDPGTSFTISQLLHLLRGTPHLEALYLVGVEIVADVKSEESFALPELTELRLDEVNPDGIQLFLSSIRLPKFNEKRHKIRRELPGEAPNNPNRIPYYDRDLDILEFQDSGIIISAGRLQFCAWAEAESSVPQFMGAVLEGLARELTSSQHIHADIKVTNRLGVAAITSILDRLDQCPNFKSIHVTQSKEITPLLTIIRLLGRPKVSLAREVWYFPHLEAISIRVEKLPFLELGAVCQRRGTAAARSGSPKEIKQLHIEPLEIVSLGEQLRGQVGYNMKRVLDWLQNILGAGQLFWLFEPWPRGVNGDEPEPTL